MEFTWKTDKWTVGPSGDATVSWAAAAARERWPGRWAPGALSFVYKGKRFLEDRDGAADLCAPVGAKIAVLGITAEDAAAPPPVQARLRDDLGPARATAAASATAAQRPRTHGGGHDGTPRYGFGEVRVLEHLPEKERARAILYEVGSHAGVLAVMKRRGWYVPVLCELPPGAKKGDSDSPAHLLGLNSGDAIHLLLRSDDGLGFRKVAADAAGFDGQWVLDVLYHELTHIEQHGDSPHSPQFYALEREVKAEAEAGVAWRRGGGRAVGGGAGEGRFSGWGEGGGSAPESEPEVQLLGGERSAAVEGLSAREAAARAAEARLAAARAAAEEKARGEGGGGTGAEK